MDNTRHQFLIHELNKPFGKPRMKLIFFENHHPAIFDAPSSAKVLLRSNKRDTVHETWHFVFELKDQQKVKLTELHFVEGKM